MSEICVRKRVLMVEEIFHEGGPSAGVPLRRAVALAVIHNPFAGSYVEEIAPFMDDLNPLGLEMAKFLVAALGGDPARWSSNETYVSRRANIWYTIGT